MGISPELYEFIVRVVEEKVRDIRVAREEFDRLVSAVNQLAAKVDRLAEGMDQLAEAQRRTEERLEQLAARVDQLAEAQRRTEERLSALESRVDRLEDAVTRLAEAQRRTEETVTRLAQAVDSLRVEVGRLSDVVGFGLEDIAKVVLPGWLQRHLGIYVGELERRFFVLDGREIEVNLYGEGRREGREVVVLGECKSRIYGRDVRRFYEEVYLPVSQALGREAVGVLFGYLIHPSAQREAESLGLYVVASYQR